MDITKNEARILGVLIEKEIKRPDCYPLTTRLVWAGCNQIDARAERIILHMMEVEATLQSLIEKNLVKEVDAPRTTRWEHNLPVPKSALPAVASLFLRGESTANELTNHIGGMTWKPTKGFVEQVLSSIPLVRTRRGYHHQVPRYSIPCVG